MLPSSTKANGKKRKNEISVRIEYKFDEVRFSDLDSALTFFDSKPRRAKATFDVMAPPKAVMLMSAKMSCPAIIFDPTADHPTPRMMGISQILTLSGSLVPLIRMPKMTENMGSKALMMCVKLTAPADMATTAPTWPTVCSILSTVHALISSGVSLGAFRNPSAQSGAKYRMPTPSDVSAINMG